MSMSLTLTIYGLFIWLVQLVNGAAAVFGTVIVALTSIYASL